MTNEVALELNEQRERFRIQEFLKLVDTQYYHRALANRKNSSSIFPHRGEDGKLFLNTFQYVNVNLKH